MKFINRQQEMRRLDQVVDQREGGLVVIWGRRRIGKTRLLLEWVHKHGGIYWVADESSPAVQRRYFARTLESRFTGFSDVDYPDWDSMLRRLAQEAQQQAWLGPLVIDEFPYLASASPKAPSIFQRWIDHEAKKAKLKVALAGSSQRMMQGLVLDQSAPLYGRASQAFSLAPLAAGDIGEALNISNPITLLKAYAFWGGVPRYWELAVPFKTRVEDAARELVLNPLGPLHEEPARLLLEETPSAASLRPILDAMGNGAHRVREIAARLEQPATSFTRPLARLQELGLVTREIPFGASEKSGKKALYKISDPFFRFWFSVVASQRSLLADADEIARKKLLDKALPRLCAQTWEELCRKAVPRLASERHAEPWEPARRFWHGKGPEWDLVALTTDKRKLLLGEVKWSERNVTPRFVERTVRELMAKGLPPIPLKRRPSIVYAVCIPRLPPQKISTLPPEVVFVDAATILGHLRDR